VSTLNPERPSETRGPTGPSTLSPLELEAKLSKLQGDVREAEVYLYRPLSEAAVSGWESRHGITLPQAYRRFLLQLGSGGEGPPYFGLWSLEDDDPSAEVFRGSFLQRELRNPFPFTTAWRWSEADEEANQRADAELRERVRGRDLGNLTLGTDGGTAFWHLVVTGRARGQVWRSEGLELLEPYAPDFLTWYQEWLNETAGF
jgi:SMI1/KNR4 family protein SUKH-1